MTEDIFPKGIGIGDAKTEDDEPIVVLTVVKQDDEEFRIAIPAENVLFEMADAMKKVALLALATKFESLTGTNIREKLEAVLCVIEGDGKSLADQLFEQPIAEAMKKRGADGEAPEAPDA